jgi:hypothetical protein
MVGLFLLSILVFLCECQCQCRRVVGSEKQQGKNNRMVGWRASDVCIRSRIGEHPPYVNLHS